MVTQCADRALQTIFAVVLIMLVDGSTNKNLSVVRKRHFLEKFVLYKSLLKCEIHIFSIRVLHVLFEQ
jgi:hypothetical protein